MGSTPAFRNVFVLCTGRCGSTTFIEACKYITNFSSAHESRANLTGDARLAYPPNHIEADNRLAWLLGRLHYTYGGDALYVHLRRNRCDTAKSFVKRWDQGIMRAYRIGVIMDRGGADRLQMALDYCDTVTQNIEYFLADKRHKMEIHLESAAEEFGRFWTLIGAEGDLDAALQAFDCRYNSSESLALVKRRRKSLLRRSIARIARGLRVATGNPPQK